MKRGLCVLGGIMCLFLSACQTEEVNQVSSIHEQVLFQSGAHFYEEWTSDVGTYQGDVIPNKDVAIHVATEIFKGVKSNISNYELCLVSYDETEKIWIVTFGEKPPHENVEILGGDCSIALQQKDGKVLRIWFGE